jgi:hypothetical protein
MQIINVHNLSINKTCFTSVFILFCFYRGSCFDNSKLGEGFLTKKPIFKIIPLGILCVLKHRASKFS